MHFSKIKYTAFLFTAMLFGSCTLDDLIGDPNHGTNGLTLEDKVVLGLKTALEVGIDSSAAAASKLNGYLTHKVIKIVLPVEADSALKAVEKLAAMVAPFASELQAMQSIVDLSAGLDNSSFTSNLTASNSLLKDITGLKGIGDSVVLYMNRAAEYAAPRSVPIFKDVIFGMTISDGLTLLNSADSSAATTYLNGKTFHPLILAYTPLVDSTLTLVPLTKYWTDFRSLYNSSLTRYNSMVAFQTSWNKNVVVASVSALQINALKPIGYKPIETVSLGTWTTDRALTGLFYLVGEEEKGIRRDPFGYVSSLAKNIADILGEVFGEIMKMPK